MKYIRLVPVLFALIVVPSSLASTINVPQDQPTIQAGINVANTGDTVLVAPGKYFENINFMGKAITVKSSGGAAVTTIDGNQQDNVATFDSGEELNSILSGFTLQNGLGGVYIANSSPTVRQNIIEKSALKCASGVSIGSASPLIQGNVIRGNSQADCDGGFGAGISIVRTGSAQIIGNLIENNSSPIGSGGGGIAMDAAGTPTLRNNVIRGNSVLGQGGGIWIINDSNPLIVQNLIYNNTASQGGGIWFAVVEGQVGPTLVNNTIVGATGISEGSAVFAGGFDGQVQFFNNLMIGLSGQNAVYCDGTFSQQPPTFTNNDAYSPKGTGLQGTCVSQVNQNGNISSNPKFLSPAKHNYQLLAGSPAINKGTNSALHKPKKDLAGHPRIVGRIIDMGAYEYQGK
jgi:parallel beta-helix repeat protein